MAMANPTVGSGAGGQPALLGQWKHGFFGCFANPKASVISCLVPCVQGGINREKVDGEHCWLASCIYCHALCYYHASTREKLRKKHNIEGDLLVDILLACCCTCCALVQEASQLEAA